MGNGAAGEGVVAFPTGGGVEAAEGLLRLEAGPRRGEGALRKVALGEGGATRSTAGETRLLGMGAVGPSQVKAEELAGRAGR